MRPTLAPNRKSVAAEFSTIHQVANWGIGAASWTRNRIVGLRQAQVEPPATILTRPLILAGSALLVDADVSNSTARVAVEVVGSHGETLRGFDAASSSLQHSSSFRHGGTMSTIMWGAGPAPGRPNRLRHIHQAVRAGESIQLRFILSGGAKLYAFCFGKMPTDARAGYMSKMKRAAASREAGV